MARRPILIIALLFLALAIPVHGLEAEDFHIQFYIVEDTIFVRNTIVFSEPINETIYLHVPEDAETIEVYVDDQKTDFNRSGKVIMIPSPEEKIQISYITDAYLDGSNFLGSFNLPFSSKKYTLTLVLPEEAILEESITDDPLSGSFFPKGAQLTSDGKSLIFIWENEYVTVDDQFSYYVKYEEKTNYLPYFLALLLLAILLGYFVFSKKPSKKQPKEKKITKSQYEHLKEEEQSIVHIIRKRDGRQIEQGTLRVVTGYSKASLSRLLSELEERNIIYKEKRGKKNLIFLK